MSYLPCENPNCHSYGRPHPNCKCHGGFAKGGKVTAFCSESRVHEPGCEYFAGGGEATVPQIKMEHLFQEPSEAQKWATGKEDKEKAVASALVHSGAHGLLVGTLGGAYKDPGKVLVNKGNPLFEALQSRMMQSGNMDGLGNLLNYTNGAAKGAKTIDSAVENLFSGAPFVDHASHEKDANEKLSDFVKDGKLSEQIMQASNQPQQFAHGGEVLPNTTPMETHLPTHNMMINEAKARVNGYLNSIRPVRSLDKLTFDSDPNLKDKENAYKKALTIANKPVSILGEIKKGTITQDSIGHFRQMYPEVYDHFSKKVSERIVKSQLDEKKPPYHVRQGLSLFLGAPLDSTFTPSSIQSAQATFARNAQGQPAQQQQSKPAKNTSKMDDISKQYRTQEDAAELRSLKD